MLPYLHRLSNKWEAQKPCLPIGQKVHQIPPEQLGESPRDDEQKHSYTTGWLNIINTLALLKPAILSYGINN